MKNLRFSLLILGLVATGLTVPPQVTPVVHADTKKPLTIDVACDGRTGALNRVNPSATAAARGDTGIVNGYIYPGGTIPGGFDDMFDLDGAPGRMGTWVCLNSRMALDPPRGSTITYYFAMPDFETAGLVAIGFNSHRREGTIPVAHVIAGGTGEFSGASGDVREEVIGTNKTGCFNLRYTFSFWKGANAPTVTGLTFNPSTVMAGESFTVTFSGLNLTEKTYFDIRFRRPGSSTDEVASDWQQGLSARHALASGLTPGTWTVTGVRAHEDANDHSGDFAQVWATATLTVRPF